MNNPPADRSPPWLACGKTMPIWLLLAAAGLGTSAATVPAVDASISASVRSWDFPGDLQKAINLSETFAHAIGVAAILGCILLTADRSRRPALWLAVMITLTSGLAANNLKGCVARVRPHSVDQIQATGAAARPNQLPQADLDFWDSRQRSLPSGHAATAWGLAIGLSLAMPRSALLFALLATLASFQRIACGAHYLSDVLAGAGIAFVSAAIIVTIARAVSAPPPAPLDS